MYPTCLGTKIDLISLVKVAEFGVVPIVPSPYYDILRKVNMNKLTIVLIAYALTQIACVSSAALVPAPEAHHENVGTPTAAPTSEDADVCAIAWTAVHLRAGQGSDSAVLDTIERGDAVTVRSKAGSWWLVDVDGRTGYVRGLYLQEVECEP